MDPLALAIALLERFLELEEGAHTHAEWEQLDCDAAEFVAQYRTQEK